MKDKKNVGKWTLLFVATLVIPFFIIVLIPLYLGFPPLFAPLLGFVAVIVALSLFKKLTKDF